MQLAPGERIDTWVVDKQLGQGAMGAVYLCHDATAVSIRAAVKVLIPSLFQDIEARFIKEAEILAQLDHPAVVRFRGCRLQSDPAYLVMEYVEGQSVEQRLQQGPIDTAKVLAQGRSLAEALAHMHSLGVH